MNELMGNAALMGLVGVIIGSLLSFLGVIYSEHIKTKKFKLEKEYVLEKALIENKQRIYKNFLDLINQYQDVIHAKIINYTDFATDEERTILLKNISSSLSELDLLAPKEVSSACRKLYYSVFNIVFDSKAFQTQYNEIVELLKNDMNVKSSD